jgi:hypothetical protein
MWGRLGKAAWSVTKGGRRLQKAARQAERSPSTEPPEALHVRPSLAQAALLVRYIAGRFVLAIIETYALSKWGFLAIAVVLFAFQRDTLGTAVGVFCLLVALVVWLVQRAATRVISRVGALDRLADLEDFGVDVATDWWPNLRAEFRRVGLKPSAWSMAKLGASCATRRLSPEKAAALGKVNWLAVIPANQLNAARRTLARAAGEA